jgi:hypothetical protein
MELQTCVSAGASLLIVWYFLANKPSRSKGLPPGPKPLPLIGNLLDVPKKKSWLTFAKWKEQYGA